MSLYKSKIKLDKKLIEEEVEKKVILNSDKIKSFFNWKPKTDIIEGLEKCIEYAKKEVLNK